MTENQNAIRQMETFLLEFEVFLKLQIFKKKFFEYQIRNTF